MDSISNFREIRRDGKVIDESMTTDRLIKLGWKPEKVTSIQWDNGGKLVEVKNPNGILARCLADRSAVVTLQTTESGLKALSIIEPAGSIRFVISDTQIINKKSEQGTFCWFEASREKSGHCFGVVFKRDIDGAMFQMEVDANSGNILNTWAIK